MSHMDWCSMDDGSSVDNGGGMYYWCSMNQRGSVVDWAVVADDALG